VRLGAGHLDALPSLERGAERAVADERERPLTVARERAGEAEDVLALGERARAEERRSLATPAELLSRHVRILRREALEVDAAVDHLDPSPRLGHDRLESLLEPVRDGDDCGGTADGDPRRRTHDPRRGSVGDVLAVRGEDGGGPARERSEQPRRNEEVRVHDVRVEPTSGRDDVAREDDVPRAASAAVDDRPRQLVPARGERRLEVCDEGA
jgi:hypothetical protein